MEGAGVVNVTLLVTTSLIAALMKCVTTAIRSRDRLSVNQSKLDLAKLRRQSQANVNESGLVQAIQAISIQHPKLEGLDVHNRRRTVKKIAPDEKTVKSVTVNRRDRNCYWTSLPSEIQQLILAKLPYENLFRSRAVCHRFNHLIESDSFQRLQAEYRSEEVQMTALHFNLKNGVWHCAGFDVVANMWRKLPPLTYLPQPDPALFKEYHVSASHGLMCMNVSKCSTRERLIVFNPLTRETRELPPMKHRRSPVLVHLHFCLVSRLFKVVVVGSSNDALLSRLTEVFESVTGEWTTSDDVPGVEFALNEYQSGVCVNGVIYCIAFLEGGQGKGLLGYDLVEGKWLVDLSCRLPVSADNTSLQLVENNKKVYLYSENEIGRNVLERRIHELEVDEDGSRDGHAYEWRAVVKHEQNGGRGLEVYPENQCVAYGEGKICVYNTIHRTGLIYDVGDGCVTKILMAQPTKFGGKHFCSLNPMSFLFNPGYKSRVW